MLTRNGAIERGRVSIHVERECRLARQLAATDTSLVAANQGSLHDTYLAAYVMLAHRTSIWAKCAHA